MSTLVFAEQNDGEIHPVTYELLGKARTLSKKTKTTVASVLLGYQIKEKAKELIYQGADKVYLLDHPSLKDFNIIRYKVNLAKLIKRIQPKIFIFGATPLGRSLAPRIAANLNTGLTADCIELKISSEGYLIQTRPAWSGNILAEIRTKTFPQMATVRYKVMKKMKRDHRRKGEIIREKVVIVENTGIKIIKKILRKNIDLTEATIIISCGRGLEKKEDVKLVEDTARELNGFLGSSRPLVDKGWIKKEHQIGFSGTTVKPKVYIACGISGSQQHLFGMQDAEIIIAINTDSTAPIFNIADYKIKGDIYKILPALIKELKKRKN